MTLGRHIQELRKTAGLSQESLGEALGVSRQAISKWESDGALPEIDKLIAMSRLFGVSVGHLLQVESDEEGRPVPDELTEREWRAVEAIAGRYAEQLKKTQPRPIKRWKKACLVIAAAILILSGWDALKTTRSSVSALEGRFNQIDSNLRQQVDSMNWDLQQLLQQEASILADWSYEINDYDPQNDLFLIQIDITPKQYVPGMTATFVAEMPDGSRLLGEGEPGAFTSFQVTRFALPLEDGIKLSVILDDGTGQQTQVLETLQDVKSCTVLRTWASFDGTTRTVTENDSVFFQWKGQTEIHIEQKAADLVKNGVQTLTLCVYQNGAVIYDQPITPSWDSARGFLEATQEVDLSIPVSGGETLAMVVRTADEYDRISYFLVQSFSVEKAENGRLNIELQDVAVEDYVPA